MEWKQIGCLNYEVSETGLIRNKKRQRVLVQRKVGNTDYMTVFLKENGKQKTYSVHRLVALAFLPNIFNKREVNHKDGNKLNNNKSNLEWVSRSENMQHMYDTGLKKYNPLHYKGKFGKDHNRSKRVICVETGTIYESQLEAQKKLKIGKGGVSWSIKHKRPIFGMHFEIKE